MSNFFISKKKFLLELVLAFLIGGLAALMGLIALLGLDGSGIVDMVRFLSAKRLIELRYVDDVNPSALMDGAISGMVQSLGDPHSVYMNADTYLQLKQHTEGSFGGIGVTMGFKDQRVTIISVMEGTPGESAGLMAGDEILTVDGTPVSEWQSEEVALHIRGEVGTQVVLGIRRAGQEDSDYTLTRDTIHVPSVKGRMLEGTRLGYIRIASFAEKTGREFRQELDSLESQGMQGLIIDLRENPGGLVTSCVEIAKAVVPSGPIVSVVERDGSREEYTSSLAESKYPIAVLVDGHSASSSEILAGALQDTGAATIVGTQSYGKGSVQIVMPLMNEDGLKLTIAKYYTPKGRSIDGTGITPDVQVELDKDALQQGQDNQLEKAKEILQQKI